MKTIDTEVYKNILLTRYEEKKKTLYEEIKRIEKTEEMLKNVTIFNTLDLGRAVAHLVSLKENEEYTFFEFETSEFYAPLLTLYPDEILIDGYIIKNNSKESIKKEIERLYNDFDVERKKLLQSDKHKNVNKKRLESEAYYDLHTKKYSPNNSYILFSTHLLGNNIDVNHLDICEELLHFSNEKTDKRLEYINDFIQEVVQQRISKILLNGTIDEKPLEEQAEDYAKSHNNELRLTMK